MNERRVVAVWAAMAFAVSILAACTARNPAACDTDADCKDPTKPFCDVKGEYVESHYTPDSCSAIPANCPVERCGCTAGMPLSCASDQSTVCGTDGKSSVTVACPLGCSPSGPQCATFDPSNGLGPALSDAANEPDIVLPDGAHIDTDLGTVLDSSNNAIAVKSVVIAQAGGPMIRVFEGKSFSMTGVVATGAYAVALVSPGAITIQGTFDAGGKGVIGGPGAQSATAACAGHSSNETCAGNCYDVGTGGGGNATPGGRGGASGSPGGAGLTSFTPLFGGCPGGDVTNGSTVVLRGAGGGGAVQLVSLAEIALVSHGFINVGGGGATNVGGGSAGNVVLEAPAIRIDGSLTGISANGGAGGACSTAGPDGTIGVLPANGPQCSPHSAGNGGTGTSAPTNGEDCSGACLQTFEGGGGGAAGRARIATKDGTFEQQGAPALSASISAEALAIH